MLEEGNQVSFKRVSFKSANLDEILLLRGKLRRAIFDPENKVLTVHGKPEATSEFPLNGAVPTAPRESRRPLQ